MNRPRNTEILFVKVDKKGNVICPYCKFTMRPGKDELLAPGIGTCGGCRRKIGISTKNARQANETLSKLRSDSWKKDVLKEQEAPQPEALPPEMDNGRGWISP